MAAYRIMGDHVNGNSIELAMEYSLERAKERYNSCIRAGVDNVKMFDISDGGCKEMTDFNAPKDSGGIKAIVFIIMAIPAMYVYILSGLIGLFVFCVIVSLLCWLFSK